LNGKFPEIFSNTFEFSIKTTYFEEKKGCPVK